MAVYWRIAVAAREVTVIGLTIGKQLRGAGVRVVEAIPITTNTTRRERENDATAGRLSDAGLCTLLPRWVNQWSSSAPLHSIALVLSPKKGIIIPSQELVRPAWDNTK